MAEALEEVAEGTVMVCAGCVVLLYAHIFDFAVLSDFAAYMACEEELGA